MNFNSKSVKAVVNGYLYVFFYVKMFVLKIEIDFILIKNIVSKK